MTDRRLLYLNTHRLSAYAWRQGKVLLEDIFENNETDIGRFADYLRSKKNSHFSLLANVAEEGHVLETIPFLQGRDRAALIARKIGQHFLGTPLATAISLGYERARRKNEKLLISALTNPAHFEPWLHCINNTETPLAGIYTVAQLGGQLLKKLGFGKGRCLLLTLQDHSIRESFLVDGQTLFSRMAPLTDSSIVGIASGFSAEAGKLHQYLVGQRQVGRDEMLPVFITAHPQALPSVESACQDRDQLTFAFIDSHIAAKRLGLHTPPEDSRSESLFLHLLEISPPRQQFAGEGHRHDYRLAQIRRGVITAGIIALLGSMLFAAKEIYQAQKFREETRLLTASETDLNGRYREISATFPQLGINNETLRHLTMRHADLTRQQRQPGPSYSLVSRALNEISSITVESIEWKIGRFSKSTAAVITGEEEITLLRGAIRPEKNASTRQVLATFENFIERLRSNPGASVTVLQQPFEMESGHSLRGGDGTDESTRPRPFALEITRKIAP